VGTEDRWTPPSAWCPNPAWWHSDTAEPDVTEWEVTELALAFVRALQPEVVVETGTSTGATALALASALVSNKHGRLWTVEIDPVLASKARARLNGYPATVVCADSLLWEPPDNIDFAWIDSGDAAHRCEEIWHWAEAGKFRPGAIIGVHDTAPSMGREVLHTSLNTLLARLSWQRLNLHTPRGVTFAQVSEWA
jgi:hypothetical protein